MTKRQIIGWLLMVPFVAPLLGICLYGLALLALKYTLGAVVMAAMFTFIAGLCCCPWDSTL